MKLELLLNPKWVKEYISVVNGHAAGIRACANCEFTPTLRMCEFHQNERQILVNKATKQVTENE